MGHCRECGTELTEKWLEVDSMSLDGVSADEVDLATWFTLEEAAENIKKGSLARKFLLNHLNKLEENWGERE